VTAILPHLLKRLIDQKRPDRCMVHGPRRGIPRSVRRAMPCMWERSRPPSRGPIQSRRPSLGDLAASLLQHGSLF
jgi:hypothetical protein